MGANNPQTVRLIDDINSARDDIRYQILGWVDNDQTKTGQLFFGYLVLGTPEILRQEVYKDVSLVNNITTDALTRKETTHQLLSYGLPFLSLVHPSVSLKDVTIGEGVLIHEHVILEAYVKISDYVAIASGAIICHESSIGTYSFISSGVKVAGLVTIDKCVTLFLGAMIAPRIKIGESAKVSAGSVIFEDVEPLAIVGGNPARRVELKNQQKTMACTDVEFALENIFKRSFPHLLTIKKDAYFADYEMLKSFEILKLILELEAVFNIIVDDAEIDECNVGSFDNLVVFLQRKLEKAEK